VKTIAPVTVVDEIVALGDLGKRRVGGRFSRRKRQLTTGHRCADEKEGSLNLDVHRPRNGSPIASLLLTTLKSEFREPLRSLCEWIGH